MELEPGNALCVAMFRRLAMPAQATALSASLCSIVGSCLLWHNALREALCPADMQPHGCTKNRGAWRNVGLGRVPVAVAGSPWRGQSACVVDRKMIASAPVAPLWQRCAGGSADGECCGPRLATATAAFIYLDFKRRRCHPLGPTGKPLFGFVPYGVFASTSVFS